MAYISFSALNTVSMHGRPSWSTLVVFHQWHWGTSCKKPVIPLFLGLFNNKTATWKPDWSAPAMPRVMPKVRWRLSHGSSANFHSRPAPCTSINSLTQNSAKIKDRPRSMQSWLKNLHTKQAYALVLVTCDTIFTKCQLFRRLVSRLIHVRW